MTATPLPPHFPYPLGHARKAMTLIEMMAVIVIISLIAGTVTVSLSGADDAAQAMRFIAGLRELDTKARLHGRVSGQPILMVLDTDRHALSLGYEGLDPPLSKLPIPNRFTIDIQDDRGKPMHKVVFDSRGRSPEYLITVRGASHARRLQFSGLTGFVQVEHFP